MRKKTLPRLRLSKETLSSLARHEMGAVAAALTTLPCSKAACTNPCNTNTGTARVGQCCC
jgi:hypothetical protein